MSRHTSHSGHRMSSAAPAPTTGRNLLFVLTALLSALVLILGLAPAAHADNRGWLRQGCWWSPRGHGVQICPVYSPAMGRNVDVSIQPARNGGNGGLYMLGGIGSTPNENQWANTPAPALFEDSNVTLIMPHGGEGEFYADWEHPGHPLFNNSGEFFPANQIAKWDTFLTGELPVYLERNFGVSRHRNSIVGISMGAVGAINLAGHHPDQFKQVLAFSGFLDPAALTHVSMATGFALATNVGGGQITEMWGSSPSAFMDNMYRSDPVASAEGLRNTDVIVFSGSGLPPAGHHLPAGFGAIVATTGEVAINASTALFVAKVRGRGIGVEHQTGPGIHAWPTWEMKLAENKGRILSAVG
ncbi:alpha/beta hydrolase [Corynebacterium aquilae]|uniref:alpha/beta hydrolase n=1 Tax=Corynebacterium aquilae TaxID=203263 RepID=UPI0014730A7C|nr:alpha/beta hydrolase family protein [Corynebacterium aquilae]